LSARQRIWMYRFIEFIGRWSMLDIFVIAILVAVVIRPACQCRSQSWRHRFRQCGDSDDACRSNFRSPTDLG
jgi:hypothetical protein